VDFLFVLIELFLLGVTAKALRANIDWKSALLKGLGQFRPNFHVEGNVPHQQFLHRYTVDASECLKTLSLTVFTQRNFVVDFLQVNYENFRAPLWEWGLRGNV